jgi:nucleoside-diphosphate-sugar epimerase
MSGKNTTGTTAPVRLAITGADGSVGRALLDRLRSSSFQTVALSRSDAMRPANELVVGALDQRQSQAAIGRSDVVVHLAGAIRPQGSNSYEAANVATAKAVARAVSEGRTGRVVMLSYVGADLHSRNEYLRTKAIAESVLRSTGRTVVVFRCTWIVGSPDAPGPSAAAFIVPPGKTARVIGSGRQVVAPVYLADVVEAVLSTLTTESSGVYELAGPDRMTLDAMVRLLNRDPQVPITHLPLGVARLLSTFVPALPRGLVETLASDSVGDSIDATQTFGLHFHSLRDIWSTSRPQPQLAPAGIPTGSFTT